MPAHEQLVEFLYGTEEEYKLYIQENGIDENAVFFITDKHIILINGKSYSTSSQTMVYLGHYSTVSDIPTINIDDNTPTYACTIGSDNILYVLDLSTGTWNEFSKLNPDTLFSKLGDYIVDTITDASTNNMIPSAKAVNDLVKSKTDSKAGQAGGLATLDSNGKIPSNQLPFSIDTAMSTTSTNPVQNKVITRALNDKVDKNGSKQLSTEDFTTEYKIKLQNLSGSSTPVQSDWQETTPTSASFIRNKPLILTQVPAAGSATNTDTNLVSARAIRTALDDITIPVDNALSSTSTNPVQNRVIYNELSKKVEDPDYVHTDNNFTNDFKSKLEGLFPVDSSFTDEEKVKLQSLSRQVNVDWNSGIQLETYDPDNTDPSDHITIMLDETPSDTYYTQSSAYTGPTSTETSVDSISLDYTVSQNNEISVLVNGKLNTNGTLSGDRRSITFDPAIKIPILTAEDSFVITLYYSYFDEDQITVTVNNSTLEREYWSYDKTSNKITILKNNLPTTTETQDYITANGTDSTFTLSKRAISIVKITIDNEEISTDSYTYLSEDNQVKFNTIPENGASIKIKYNITITSDIVIRYITETSILNRPVNIGNGSGDTINTIDPISIAPVQSNVLYKQFFDSSLLYTSNSDFTQLASGVYYYDTDIHNVPTHSKYIVDFSAHTINDNDNEQICNFELIPCQNHEQTWYGSGTFIVVDLTKDNNLVSETYSVYSVTATLVGNLFTRDKYLTVKCSRITPADDGSLNSDIDRELTNIRFTLNGLGNEI